MSDKLNNAAINAIQSGYYATERTKQEVNNKTELTKGGIDALKSQISANTTDGSTNHASGLDLIRESAQQVHAAAKDAAEVAKETLPTPPVRTGDPVSDLENGLKAKTDEAVAEGKRDVQQVTQQSAGYVQQAKNLGAATLQSLQSYAEAGSNAVKPDTSANGVLKDVQSVTSSALGAAAGYLSSAAQTVQPRSQTDKGTGEGKH